MWARSHLIADALSLIGPAGRTFTETNSNKQLAARMFLAEKTVKNYVSGLLRALGMERRTQAAVYGATLRRP